MIKDLLKNKVAVVTGGTRGIGLAIVRLYLEQGAKVILFGSRQETADKAVAELKAEKRFFVHQIKIALMVLFIAQCL